MFVKICGIRSLEDAIISSSFMPDYMGLIFCESPRKINVEIGKLIANNLNTKKFIGVFQDNQIEEILKIAKICNLFGIQLHGDESPKDIEIIKENNLIAIKAFRIADRLPENLSEYKPDYFLFDKTKECKSLNTNTLENYNLNIPFFIAGGLKSENIHETLKKVSNAQFCGIDLSSGVEKDNKKDPVLLENFFALVRNQIFF
jgi:phosphoribosylanthranilate isomerase